MLRESTSAVAGKEMFLVSETGNSPPQANPAWVGHPDVLGSLIKEKRWPDGPPGALTLDGDGRTIHAKLVPLNFARCTDRQRSEGGIHGSQARRPCTAGAPGSEGTPGVQHPGARGVPGARRNPACHPDLVSLGRTGVGAGDCAQCSQGKG